MVLNKQRVCPTLSVEFKNLADAFNPQKFRDPERGSPHPQQAESAEAVRVLELALLLGIAAGEDTRAPVCPCFAHVQAYNIYEQFKVAQLTLL